MNDIAYVENLRRSYQGREVLRGVSFRLAKGHTYFLVGPNGCGKTTTVETLIGLRRLYEGQIRILDSVPGDRSLRHKIRVCLQDSKIHAQVTPREYFRFIASLYDDTKSKITEIAAQFEITDLLDRKFGKLSGGQQKRVLVASTLFGESDLIVLDEPTSGVDLESRLSLWASLQQAISERRTTLLITTHDLNEAEQYADEVIIMRKGVIHAMGNVDKLIAESGLVGVLPTPTIATKNFFNQDKQPGRHILNQDRETTILGYTDRQLLIADSRRLEEKSVIVRERSPRLADAYLLKFRGEL